MRIEGPAGWNFLSRFLRRHDFAARSDRERKIYDKRRPIRQRRGEGDRIGADHRRPAAPERHRFGRIAEQERHEPGFRQPFNMRAGLAEMMRATDRGERHNGLARQRAKLLNRQIDRRIGKTMRGVDERRRG